MTNTQRKVIQIAALVLFIFFGCGFFGAFLSRYQAKKNLNSTLGIYANDMNGECPIAVGNGNEMVIQKVYYDKEKTIVYEYRMLNYNKSSFDLKSMKDGLSEIIIADLVADQSLAKLRNNDVIFDYRYYDNQNEKMFEIKILFNTPLKFID
jgi:hypothetical protein